MERCETIRRKWRQCYGEEPLEVERTVETAEGDPGKVLPSLGAGPSDFAYSFPRFGSAFHRLNQQLENAAKQLEAERERGIQAQIGTDAGLVAPDDEIESGECTLVRCVAASSRGGDTPPTSHFSCPCSPVCFFSRPRPPRC